MCHEHKVRDTTRELGLRLGREHSGAGLSRCTVMSREHSGAGQSRSCHVNTVVPDCHGARSCHVNTVVPDWHGARSCQSKHEAGRVPKSPRGKAESI